MSDTKASQATPRNAPKKDTPAGTKAYLIAYNLASAAGWSYVLYQTIQHLSGATAPPPALASEQTLAAASSLLTRVLAWLHALLPALVPAPSLAAEIHAQLPAELKTVWQRAGTLHAALGDTVAAVQTAAVLEVAHAALGIVRSPLVTTFMQVLSRLIAVWAIADRIEVARTSPLYTSCVLAWSVTEIIRYTFYAFSLAGGVPRALLWIRYTAFYILYPLGAGSEAFLMFATLPHAGDAVRRPQVFLDGMKTWDTGEWVRAAMFVIWWPSLYVLYTHMIGQRRKVLGGGRKLKTE